MSKKYFNTESMPEAEFSSHLREEAQERERTFLHPKAALSRDHDRYGGPDDDHRLAYHRDVDRIVHSKAYMRYVDKTQVVHFAPHDHVTHRGLHVQLVSCLAKGLADMLGFNGHLVEAISLAHDVGHPPFAHEGEECLSELSLEHGNGLFAHSWQSCHLLRDVEPLNLGLAVYDGILCHDGGAILQEYVPQFGKGWDDHYQDLADRKAVARPALNPSTLEGCLVKLSDTISYIGRDIEDAVSLGVITRSDIPETSLGRTCAEILGAVTIDVLRHSLGKDFITMSADVCEALKTLRSFNYTTIYTHPKLKLDQTKISRAYRILFSIFLNDIRECGEESYVWRSFVHNRTEAYRSQTSDVQMVIDYIAGMTDSYFVRTLRKFVVPYPEEPVSC